MTPTPMLSSVHYYRMPQAIVIGQKDSPKAWEKKKTVVLALKKAREI